jgi:MFS family permease
VLAAILTAATCLSRIFALRSLPTTATASVPALFRTGSGPGRHVPQFGLVLMTFALGSLASAAFTANIVPALGEQGVSLTAAAMFGGLLGVMQLPGRLLLMNGPFAGSPARLVLISLLLQGVGLAAVALARSVFVVGGGIAAFAVGAGLLPLVRPHVVQTVFDVEVAGYLNGRLALVQQLARASGPVLTALLAAVAGYRVVFALLAVTLAAVAVVSHRAVNRLHSSITHERSRHDPTAQPATIVG